MITLGSNVLRGWGQGLLGLSNQRCFWIIPASCILASCPSVGLYAAIPGKQHPLLPKGSRVRVSLLGLTQELFFFRFCDANTHSLPGSKLLGNLGKDGDEGNSLPRAAASDFVGFVTLDTAVNVCW